MIDDVVDWIQDIPGIQTLLYADDLIIWATSSNVKALEDCMNVALERLSRWAGVNELVVNPEKTEFQLFTMSTKTHIVNLKYEDIDLRRTSEATYLGIKLDTRLTWSKHTEAMAERGIKRSNLLKRLAGTKWGANQDVLTLGYKSYVRPAMEYGIELSDIL